MSDSLKKHILALVGFVESLKLIALSLNTLSGNHKVEWGQDFLKGCEELSARSDLYLKQAGDLDGRIREMKEELTQIKREMVERDRLLIEYDKSNHALSVEQKKPTQTHLNLQAAQARFDQTKDLYEQKNARLLESMISTLSRRYLETDFSQFLQSLSKFLVEEGKAFKIVSQQMALLESVAGGETIESENEMASENNNNNDYSNKKNKAKDIELPCQAQALYGFTAENEMEMSISAGDVITVLRFDHPDWWFGQIDSKNGRFPSNYVRLLPHN
eukprot:TRINITY_DN3941_c0_g1_i1.p1 TRINITY_DN3941_c0_g1~~TRINITY_DN3941_c0_g1_i1.p1  ORF type:complete len:274 (-),score=62.45 TRINITY_DN3941_c0_g1_i1:71-892(-)